MHIPHRPLRDSVSLHHHCNNEFSLGTAPTAVTVVKKALVGSPACLGAGTVTRVVQPASVGGVSEVGRAHVAIRADYLGKDACEGETVTRPAHVRLDGGLDGGATRLW